MTTLPHLSLIAPSAIEKASKTRLPQESLRGHLLLILAFLIAILLRCTA